MAGDLYGEPFERGTHHKEIYKTLYNILRTYKTLLLLSLWLYKKGK